MAYFSSLTALLNDVPCVVLDGALATELEVRGCQIADSLWSASVLINKPELITQLHYDYFLAGASIAITASYQATLPGLVKYGLSETEARNLIVRSATLAIEARQRYYQTYDDARPLFVAGSIGPYGAWLGDGSEYTGAYQCSSAQFINFHRPRIEALLNAGVDLLACETLPNAEEIQSLAQLISHYPTAQAWFCFTLRDDRHLSDGTPLSDIVRSLQDHPQIIAIGINCIALQKTTTALQHLQTLTDLPLIVYPNSGELYDAKSKSWHNKGDKCQPLTDYLKPWLAAGAKIIGGCCRTTPEDIKALSQALREMQ